MAWKWFVEFLGNLTKLPKTSPGNTREVVMFVVKPNIIGKEVQRTVIRVCLHRCWTVGAGVLWQGVWPLKDVLEGTSVNSGN